MLSTWSSILYDGYKETNLLSIPKPSILKYLKFCDTSIKLKVVCLFILAYLYSRSYLSLCLLQ